MMKKLFMTIILGISCIGIGVGAATFYQADTVRYGDGNVDDALDDLYNMKSELDTIKSKGTATESQILSGQTAVVQGREVTGTAAVTGTIIEKQVASFSGTTSAGGNIIKRIYAADYGMSRIIGLSSAGIEESIGTVGHNLSLAPSADGSYADLSCYMSYGGKTITCYARILGFSL